VCDATGQGSAKVASCAQQLLEHSLLTELQGVVARTLQGVDMFSQQQLAGTLPASHTDAALPASKVGPSHGLIKHWSCLCGDALLPGRRCCMLLWNCLQVQRCDMNLLFQRQKLWHWV